MVAVEDSESNWSSQYRMSTVMRLDACMCSELGWFLRADFPAPDGPIMRIFSVGSDSSDAIFAVVTGGFPVLLAM